jgi:hypothetical protein
MQTNTKYPYLTKKRIAVYGGHASFLRVMKQRFPNVKFIKNRTIVDPNVIRLADAVWIQNNSISHSQYYNVIHIANTHKVPIKYFSNAGTGMSSRQLIDYDVEEM